MRNTVSVSAEVYVDDVLDDLTDKEIEKIAEERGLKFKFIAHADLIEAVERIVPVLQSRGFIFKTVSQLLCPNN